MLEIIRHTHTRMIERQRQTENMVDDLIVQRFNANDS